jgi:hypothetical protein
MGEVPKQEAPGRPHVHQVRPFMRTGHRNLYYDYVVLRILKVNDDMCL